MSGRLAFFNLVKQMRQAQKDFYASKGQDWQTVLPLGCVPTA